MKVNFIKKDVIIAVIIIIIIIIVIIIVISFENLSMTFNKPYKRLLTGTKSIRNPNTIKLST